MRLVAVLCAAVVATSAGAGASQAKKAPSVQKVVLAAIARQAALGHLSPTDARADRSAVNRAVLLARKLPGSRSGPMSSQLAQAAAIAPKLTAPRAAAIFGQLLVNDNWFAGHGPAASATDITDADGVVYRYFPGRGFEFHPLGNFGALNAAIAAKNVALTARLGNALALRGVPATGGGTGWEYYFNFEGGRAPWLSGFAQAVAAQAFSRAAVLDTADAARFSAMAHAAYKAIPGRLERETSFGPWIKLYAFSRAVVLNAELQSAISLGDYAKATSDTGAATLAASMKEAAARALPSFSTGFWSYYQLPSEPSPQSYQTYVIQLLQSLSKSDPRFAAAAETFAGFETTRPSFKLADSGAGSVNFWISKPATVTLSALGGTRQLSVAGGWHTVSWSLPSRPGIFPVAIHATDWAGNAGSVEALPIVHVAAPPAVKKKKGKPVRTTAGIADSTPVTTVTVNAGTTSPPPVAKTTTAATTTTTTPVPVAPAATLPPLVVGAGLDQSSQGVLAQQQGLKAARMTLVWPAGSAMPEPGVITALDRLPAGTDLVLDLYASPLPADPTGLAALTSYATILAQQVTGLQDLVLAPGVSSPSAGVYETALAAVYDAVKQAAPLVRVDAAIDGTLTPKATVAALAAAYRSSGRPTPIMDQLVFAPAPAAGKGLWPLASTGTLIAALESGFGGTAQAGGSLPLLIDGLAVQSLVPSTELSLYSSPDVGMTGLSEAAQAAAYVAALKSAACRPTVTGVLLARLVDGAAVGQQSGLFYPDGSAKTSLQAVVQAAAAAQGAARCGGSTGGTTTTTTTTTTPGGTTTTTTTPVTPTAPGPADDPSALAFPTKVTVGGTPQVKLGCVTACLYLVAMQRATSGAPILARRGSLARAGATTVTLPKERFAAGDYRFSVWIVGAANPGPVSIDRSPVVAAS